MTRSFPFFSGRNTRKDQPQVRRRTRLTFQGLEERRLMAVTPIGSSAKSPAIYAQAITPSTAADVSNHAAAQRNNLIGTQIVGFHDLVGKSDHLRDLYNIELTPEERFGAGDWQVIPVEKPIDVSRYELIGFKPGLPILNSNPTATHTLYLNFTGSRMQADWTVSKLGGQNLRDHRVVFDMDGNSNSFNAEEQAAITRIWQYVADDYAPFNVNVTTYNGDKNPSSADDNVLEVAIGGSAGTGENALYGLAHGEEGVVSYQNSQERAVFVFSHTMYLETQSIFFAGPDYFARAVADTISHESGHAYGLAHQGEPDGDEWIDYREADGDRSLIMGRGAKWGDVGTRSLWAWSEYDAGRHQDDLAILSQTFQTRTATASWTGSGDGLRNDDVPDHLYHPLSQRQQGQFHASGFIGINPADPSALDEDWFAFQNPGGPMHLRLHSPAGEFGNLHTKIELWKSHNTPEGMIADYLVHESSRESWQNGFGFTSLLAGDYMIRVSSNGGYGNLGNYVLDVSAFSGTGGLKVGGSVTGGIQGMASMVSFANMATMAASPSEPSLAPRFLSEAGSYQTQMSWNEGVWTDGYWTEGATTEGFWTEGSWTDGSWTEGFWTDGYWTDGTSTEGFWTDGSWADGSWTDGSWIDGYWGDDAWVDGYWSEGYWIDGSWTDGYWTDGVTTDGFWTDGYWTDGALSEGYWTDAFWTDGTSTEAFWTDGQWTEGYWTEELAYVVAIADAEALGLWTDEYWMEQFAAADGIFDDLDWAALNPPLLPPAENEAETAAIDEAIEAFSEEQWSGLADDALIDLLAELA